MSSLWMADLPNLHPVWVHFPIALIVTALGCDVALTAFWQRPWLDRTVVMLYALAALSSGGAAISGKLAERQWTESLAPATQTLVEQHGDWAFFAVLMLFAAAAFRFDVFWRERKEAPERSGRRWLGLGIAAVALLAVLVTASRGGKLVYRYGVGVASEGS